MEKLESANRKRIYSDAERQAPINLKEAEPSHLARYQFALKFILPQDNVLDVPCGSGYGTKLISTAARKAVGIDIHKGAIGHAKEFFSDKNNSFSIGNIEDMRGLFPDDNLFDVIISFEGIEHINNSEAFLDEVVRLLKKDGEFIISTPRKPHGSPYHVKEYNLDEFKELLSKKFDIRQIFGQIHTDIFDLNEKAVNPHDYKRFNFIAICKLKTS